MSSFDTPWLRRAAIHVADEQAQPAAFAAAELQRYLQRMTGVQVPIARGAAPNTLVLGAATPLPTALHSPEAYVINPEPARVTLQAGSPRALLSAVYAFLERLGC